MRYEFAKTQDLDSIGELLKICDLPSNDIREYLEHFIVASDQSLLVGCIGLEPDVPLLRSLAVEPSYRGQGIAQELCARLLTHATTLGIRDLYLLTTTADRFFDRAGFQRLDRSSAPENIRLHKQFSELCPSSAALMHRQLI